MAIIYRIEDRRVIPNWRDFRRTTLLGELSATNGNIEGISTNLQNQIQNWNDNPSLGTAADLLNVAYIFNAFDQQEVKEATKFIVKNCDRSSTVLLKLARQITGHFSSPTDTNLGSVHLEVATLEDFTARLENQTHNKVLRLTRNLTKSELRNPMLWVDLARLYSFMGLAEKAENAMLVALQLAPNNRHVLRSSTRMFIHFDQVEKALFYLRKSESVRTDPWLTSAHIATSSLIGRYSPLIRNGFELVQSSNFSAYEKTELSSSLGTLEYQSGAFKKARHYIGLSLQAPNDNSLAQVEWLSQLDNHFAFDPTEYGNVTNPFEAFAFEAYQMEKWGDAVENSINWFLDIPFSRRPVVLGSYIACTYLKDYALAIMFCEAGLQANPRDPTILNNIAYSHLMQNDVNGAENYINRIKMLKDRSLAPQQSLSLQATLGLNAFKIGDFAKGEHLYETVISRARALGEGKLETLASINYLRELVLAKRHEKINVYHNSLLSTGMSKYPELRSIMTDVINLFSSFKGSND